MTSGRNEWRPWDPIPPPHEPCKNDREEREYDLSLSDPNRCFGKGIEEDPMVIWIDRPDYRNRNMVWAHNNFAKAIAKVLGFTHSWIIKGAHNQEYARDAAGRKILVQPPDRYLLKHADMHITLRLGTGLYECRLAAHAYVVLDASGHPDKYMSELARRFRRGGGGDPRLEFWRWQSRHRRLLPRRPLNLGTNWEAHANVGPYLDTYRPDARAARGDTYTPRSDATPPRRTSYFASDGGESDGSDDSFIEGTMTREMAALVERCNAAYFEYQAFHERLVAMEYPPADGLVELHAMREQIVTMQREVYHETKGILL
ncbi:hypothetical protein GGS24DRAFT_275804 [Hypoxylon argillaceum]|nr:hypothetical protein GGS24DRAFT_275804 [Hypoxylon argillaceum]KAI1147691.1 hypothetical protein F4825DRAFT_133744 [Nemania diffusa]